MGDDVFGEDPTVQKLEERVAEILGKEAAVFVPSGVMGNQIALALHTRPGDEVVLAERSHIFHYESGAPGQISGVQLRPVGDATGILLPSDVEAVVRGAFDWEPRTSLLCLENTINKAGGLVFPLQALRAVTDVARANNLALHLDGARLWNASVASGTPEAKFSALFDTVNVSLSKGLGAPVGSLLAGSSSHITEARRLRKRLGGGMRQSGILAAAGLLALEHRGNLAADHTRARTFAEALAGYSAFRVIPPETNIVLFDTLDADASAVLMMLEAEGVRLVPFGPRTLRATFHRDVSDDDVDQALDAVQRLFG